MADRVWYGRAAAAYRGLNRTDPQAVWSYQGFAFVNWKGADKTRALVAGRYMLSVGGHQPHDAEGSAGSSGKVVSATITVN